MKYHRKSRLNKIMKIFIIIIMILFITKNSLVMKNNNEVVSKRNLYSINILNSTNFENTISFNSTELNLVKKTYSGFLTGYVYNCPKCTKKLACEPTFDLTKGNINYNDYKYGNIRIIAASNNVKCGSIISINALEISEESIIAIVLDRGVNGNNIDLLTCSEEEAYKNIGNTKITYEILREGY